VLPLAALIWPIQPACEGFVLSDLSFYLHSP
jgi:hypothetical protein